MNNTHHMTSRMQQRGLSKVAVELALELGEWNSRGDQLSVGMDALDEYIRSERRKVEAAERLRRRGGATVVLDRDTLITIYDQSQRGHR